MRTSADPVAIAAIAAALVAYGVATIHEALGRRGLATGINLLVGPGFAGPAATVAMPAGDNLGLHALLAEAPPGSVLCVGSEGRGAFGVLGDLLVAAARARGVAGILIDDGIRDLNQLDPPPSIAARGITSRGTRKRRLLSLNAPIGLAGVLIRPGDWIVGDVDGICVIPADRLDTLLESAEARTQKEVDIRTALQAGRTSVEVLGLSPILQNKENPA